MRLGRYLEGSRDSSLRLGGYFIFAKPKVRIGSSNNEAGNSFYVTVAAMAAVLVSVGFKLDTQSRLLLSLLEFAILLVARRINPGLRLPTTVPSGDRPRRCPPALRSS